MVGVVVSVNSSAFCFINHKKQVECVPVTEQDVLEWSLNGPNNGGDLGNNHVAYAVVHTDNGDPGAEVAVIANGRVTRLPLPQRNLLYNLNNPSFSDLENDSSMLKEGSHSPQPDEEASGETQVPISPPISGAHSLNGCVCNTVPTSLESTGSPPQSGESNVDRAIFLPKVEIELPTNDSTKFKELKQLLLKISGGWDEEQIEVKQLTGGITNMLLSCKYLPTDETRLVRIYGNGTNLIIDRHREFILHLILHSLSLAPPIYCRFKNGLVYGFSPGRSLKPEEMYHDNLYPLIAQQLGNWHHKLDFKAIDQGVEKLRDFSYNLKKLENQNYKAKKLKKKYISNIWELIEDWINIVPVVQELIESFQENNPDLKVDSTNITRIMLDEFKSLQAYLLEIESPIVASHCDLLSGNIIVPKDWDLDSVSPILPHVDDNAIKFIDFEYMLPAARAFDIANHLAEWQGFDCNREAIPKPVISNPVLVKWCKSYLNNPEATQAELEEIIKEIRGYYGLPGFYWGVWAMIQSEISSIDFNYAEYGKSRLQEYWDWKKEYMHHD